jgi:hypothetical protein
MTGRGDRAGEGARRTAGDAEPGYSNKHSEAGLKSLLAELRLRGVIRAAALYVAVAWGATEILAFLIEALWPASDVPRAKQLLAVAFVAGFPVAMYLAWSRDLGLRGRRVLVALTLAAVTGGALVWLAPEVPVATDDSRRPATSTRPGSRSSRWRICRATPSRLTSSPACRRR